MTVGSIIAFLVFLWYTSFHSKSLVMNNYLDDAYKQISASALSVSPAGDGSDVRGSGIHWAISLLGFPALGMAVIPFVIIRYGVWIRKHSRFCKSAVEEEERRKRWLGRE